MHDLCLHCKDSIVYVGITDTYQSATAAEDCNTCPVTGGHHVPSYTVS